ncbi:MAG: hypothetical protein IPJ75_09720 [Ignavibacteriales bacterium]|nr:hypothetical protein [Ignavibacteriales bacterium]
MINKKELEAILNNPFNLQDWKLVLTEFFGTKNLRQQPVEILLPLNDKAKCAFELGSFNTIDDRIIGLYHVIVKSNVRLEKNKFGLRQLLRSIYKYYVDGALVVFEQGSNWRLSFVSEIRTFDGTGALVKNITEPKRYTYLLGEAAKTSTPVSRITLLEGKEISLEDIRNAF